MARGDVVIANSRFTAELILARYATPRAHRGHPSRRRSSTFDPDRIAAERVAELRRRWGVAPEERVILHAARLTRWKGQSVLHRGCGPAPGPGPLQGAVVVLAGDAQGRDGYVERCSAQIERLDLERTCPPGRACRGHRGCLLAAHVTVVASIEPEAFGRAAIEAAAVACPVIATNIGAPPETVLAQPTCGTQGESRDGWCRPATPGRWRARCRGPRPGARGPRRDRGEGPQACAGPLHDRGHAAATLGVYDRLLGTDLQNRFDAGCREDIP